MATALTKVLKGQEEKRIAQELFNRLSDLLA